MLEPFSSVLADMLSDFDAAEATAMLPDDEVQRLSLAAHHTVIAQNGGQLPRPGVHAYSESVTPQPVVPRSTLDVRF